MGCEPGHRPLLPTLLVLLRGEALTGPNEDEVIEGLIARFSYSAFAEDWRMAIAEAMRMGYVYDPVRLEPGSLQCRWRLELTPQGFEAVQGEQR